MKRRDKMFCSVYKWLISQAADSGKPIAGHVKRHANRCDTCREFTQLCEELKPKFAQDKQTILKNNDEALNKKIITALDRESISMLDRQVVTRRLKAPRPALLPALAAVFLVLAVSISIIFLTGPRSEKATSMGRISELVSAAAPEEMLVKVESPLEREYVELKKSLDSTTRFLLSSLNFRIGQQAE